MNKKVLFLSLLFSCGIFSLSAQEEFSRDLIPDEVEYGQPNQTYNTYKTTWKKNAFKDNWTISVGGGAQILMGIDDNKGSFTDRVTFAPQISISKYFSPIWGLRLNFTGGSLHGFNDGSYGTYVKWNHGTKNYMGQSVVGTSGYPTTVGAGMLTWDPTWNSRWDLTTPSGVGYNQSIIGMDGDNYYWIPGRENGALYMDHVRYFQFNVDFMFDLFNLFGNYNPKRFFELTPFGGVGFYNSFSHMGNDNIMLVGAHAGLIGKFRLSEKFALHAEVSGSVVGDSFDGQTGDNQSMDGIAQATLSVAYKFGKTSWDVAAPMDAKLINKLNNDINILRESLANQKCPTCPPPPPPVEVRPTAPVQDIKFLPDPVFFRIDKSVIDQSEWMKIDKAANYLNQHPEVNVVVTGYADKKTAYPEYNMKLSERRAKAVSKALIERYGINPARVSINWSGDRIQPFTVNEWNRVVIFVIE
ncbi:OmpA family protein [Dysgonomonas macrotermitis]|uniref:Outer membrane protein OmpA n=1 Tax=Dysgonomonas macrotermitis TaxID=1346286 RepID=A0A1M5IAJ7_9BACT|nr:OmpA family protein [Dysgonomonas macrotermitis]SHG25326.1 Outer membrane protein OmpA [Dysgonomonas macrotermitis]